MSTIDLTPHRTYTFNLRVGMDGQRVGFWAWRCHHHGCNAGRGGFFNRIDARIDADSHTSSMLGVV